MGLIQVEIGPHFVHEPFEARVNLFPAPRFRLVEPDLLGCFVENDDVGLTCHPNIGRSNAYASE